MGKTILVVDDDEPVRKSISIALKLKGGFDTLEAEDGLIGLELAKQHHPDLIISDVIMENLNGFLMLETLKEFPETADIPIIMMTVQAQTDKIGKLVLLWNILQKVLLSTNFSKGQFYFKNQTSVK